MKKFRMIIIFSVLVALLIPGTVSAAGVFYCSTTDATGGDGSYDDPWACTDAAELDIVINDQICDIYTGGYLYQVFPDSYRYHVVTWYSVDDCRVTSTVDYAGIPPYTGVEVPTPYIVAGAVVLGAGLLVAGIFLRRKKALVAI